MRQDELLRDALDAHGLSIRRCGFLLAERKGTRPENERRQLARWLNGQAITDENAEHLAAVLGYPDDYFKGPVRTRPLPAWREEAAELRTHVRDLEHRLRALESRPRRRRAERGGQEAG